MKMEELERRYQSAAQSTGLADALLAETEQQSQLRWRINEDSTGEDGQQPTLSVFSDRDIEELLLQQLRWEERQEALSDVKNLNPYDLEDFNELPYNVEKTEEHGEIDYELRPLSPEILKYLEACPKDEWDSFYERSENVEFAERAAEDYNVFMEYCFADKDGKAWAQEPFHRDWQHLIPTANEAKKLARGEEIIIQLEDGTLFEKKLTTLIGAPREHAKCCSAETKVLLANGMRIRADAMEIGKKYLLQSWSPKKGYSNQWGKCWQNTIQQIVQLKTRSGKKLRVSPEHPIWIAGKWKAAKDVVTGDRLAVSRKGNFGNLESAWENLDPGKDTAWLIGFMLGNGSLTKMKAWVVPFSSGKQSVLDKITKICNEKGWEHRRLANLSNSIYSEEFAEILVKLGLKGKDSYGKHIPEEVFGWTKNSALALVQGLFDADGCYSQCHLNGAGRMAMRFASVSEEMMMGVQSLLFKIGVCSHMDFDKIKKTYEAVSPRTAEDFTIVFNLHVKGNNALKLVEKFDCDTDKMQGLHEAAKFARPQTGFFDTIPNSLLDNLIENRKSISCRSKYRSLGKVAKNGCGRDIVLDYAVEFQNAELYNNAEMYWDEVSSVEIQAPEMTYSVEVENTHVHITDDFITHNTTQMSVGRVIWEIGRNTAIRVKIVTASDTLAKDIVFEISRNIERNPKVAQVFPNLKPDYSAGWTKAKLFVMRDIVPGAKKDVYISSKDATVEAKAVLATGAGGRADILIFDDVIDQRNAVAQPALRKQVEETIRNVWIPLMPTDGRCWYSATPWHTADFTHQIKSDTNWAHWWKAAYTEEFVLSADGDVTEVRRQSLWPSKWSQIALRIRRGIIGERAFTQQFLLVALSDEDATFRESDLEKSFDSGRNKLLGKVPHGWTSFAGVDLASSMKKKAAFTVIFTIAVEPLTGKRIPVEIVRAKLTFPQTIAKMKEQWQKHGWNLAYVENNGFQAAVVTALEDESKGMPVRGFHTGSQKADQEVGLPGLAVVFGNGGWKIPVGSQGDLVAPSHAPDCQCELCVWLSELRSHPLGQYSDTVMASWFAERAAVAGGSKFEENYHVYTNVDLIEIDLDSRSSIEALQIKEEEKNKKLFTTQAPMDIENMMWANAWRAM